MKKIIFVSLFLFFVMMSFAQSKKYDTVIKMQTEREYSKRIEEMLEPFIGKNVVVTKLTLKYPTLLKSIIAQFENPVEESDARITKSKAAIMSKNEIKEEVDETRIVRKDVTIYVDKQLDSKQIQFVKDSVKRWFNFTPKDKLKIIKKLDLTQDNNQEIGSENQKDLLKQEADATNSNNNKFLMFLMALAVVLLVAFLFIFNSGLKRIATARHNVNVTGFDKLISAFANMSLGGAQSSSSEKGISADKPLPVRLLREKRGAGRTSFDFHFLERLSIDSFYNILITLSLEDAAFIIGSVSKEYSAKFLEKYSDKIQNILAHLLKEIVKSKHEIEALRKKVFEKFLKVLENEAFSVDGAKEITHIINNLSVQKTIEVFNEVKKINPPLSEKIRKNILFLDDIKDFSDEKIEFLVLSIDHDLISEFLYVMQDDRDLVEKFFRNMTDRSKSIIKEDIEMMDEMTESEKQVVKDKFLYKVRKILKYI